jgi:hypothetical protein
VDEDQKRPIGRSGCMVKYPLVVGVGDFVVFERCHLRGIGVEVELGIGVDDVGF